jgi:hypothetical protein
MASVRTESGPKVIMCKELSNTASRSQGRLLRAMLLWYENIQTRRVTFSGHYRSENAGQGSVTFTILAYRSKTDLRTKVARMANGRADPNNYPPPPPPTYYEASSLRERRKETLFVWVNNLPTPTSGRKLHNPILSPQPIWRQLC